jgi:hypothetical protein
MLLKNTFRTKERQKVNNTGGLDSGLKTRECARNMFNAEKKPHYHAYRLR